MPGPTPDTPDWAGSLRPPLATIRDGFDTIQSATMTLSRLMGRVAEPGSAAAEPLSRLRAWVMSERAGLVGAMQARDSLDQRIAHIESILTRLPMLDPDARAWAECVTAGQLRGIAGLLTESGAAAERAFAAAQTHLTAAGPDHAPDGAMTIATQGRAAVAVILGAAADLGVVADRIDQSVMPEGAADLAWISALYTMDAERDIHAKVARAIGTPRAALRA